MQALTERYQPKTLADFAGLGRPKAVLGSFASSPYSASFLFVGPAGTGKTTMAFALARQIGGETYHIPAQKCDLETVNRIIEKCHYRPWRGNWNFVICDEADRMSKAAQIAWLSKLDSTAAPPDTIVVFTANETVLLEDRFLSRCRTLHFETADILEPAAALLARVWNAEAPAGAETPDFRRIVQDSGLNVRGALNELELEILAPGTRPKLEPAPVGPRDELPPRSSHRKAPARPISAGGLHCPISGCGGTSANRQGVIAHLRLIHGQDKAARDSLMAAAGL